MKTYIKMSQSDDTIEFSKKRKRNDEEQGQDQVLSFRELKLILIKKFEDINENFFVETKHLARKLRKSGVSSFNYKGNRIQHAFNLNPIKKHGSINSSYSNQKGSISCNTVQKYLPDDLVSDSEYDKKLKAAEAPALRKQN